MQVRASLNLSKLLSNTTFTRVPVWSLLFWCESRQIRGAQLKSIIIQAAGWIWPELHMWMGVTSQSVMSVDGEEMYQLEGNSKEDDIWVYYWERDERKWMKDGMTVHSKCLKQQMRMIWTLLCFPCKDTHWQGRRRSKWSCRHIPWNKGDKIGWLLELQNLECYSGNLEIYSVTNRKPMQIRKNKRFVGETIFLGNDPSECILNKL